MNCKCVDEIQKTMVGVVWKERKIIKASLKEIAFGLGKNSIDLVTVSHAEAVLDGLKKPQLITINHSYCPFCGTKIGKEENSEPVNPSDDASKN